MNVGEATKLQQTEMVKKDGRDLELPGNLPHDASEFLISKPLGKCKI